jgi:hypothetical protein
VRTAVPLLVVLACAPATARADRGHAAGMDATVTMSLPEFSDVAGIGVGAAARFEVALHRHLRATARGGFIFHLIKNELNTTEWIGLVGLTYYVTTDAPGELFWIEGGIDRLSFSTPEPAIVPPDTAYEFAVGLGVGYDAGAMEARIGFWIPTVSDVADNVGAFMASLGARFYQF